MLVVRQWYLVPQTATRLLLPSSLLPPLQSPAGPADAGLCPDTQSAVASHPVRDREIDQGFHNNKKKKIIILECKIIIIIRELLQNGARCDLVNVS